MEERELLINKDTEQPTKWLVYLKLRVVTWIRILIILLVIILLVIGIVVFKIQKYIPDVLRFINKIGVWGAVLFILIYIVCTIAFIPGSLLTLGGGFLFGLYFGVLIVWIGAVIGCIMAFLLGRTLLRTWVEEQVKAYPKFKAVDGAIQQQGWKIVLLVRLIPILPFNLLNYGLALTNVSLFHYCWASAIGMLPGTCLSRYVYIGSLAKSIAEAASGTLGPDLKVKIIIYAVSGVLLVAVIVFITIIGKRAIDKALAEQQQNDLPPVPPE